MPIQKDKCYIIKDQGAENGVLEMKLSNNS